MGNSVCHSLVFVRPVNDLQRLFTINFNLYLAENKAPLTGLPLELNGMIKTKGK